jgi:GLPGLI family protein
MKKNILVFALCFITAFANAQTQFYSTIKIEFEKKVAVHALYKEIEPEWFEQIKERFPQTSSSYFDFIADGTHSIYKPGREVTADPKSWYQPFANKNIVYTDYKTEMSISQKPIFEETFLVQDSLLNIKWKITEDARNIAGFECRKAVGILFDTVAIFAFYTDELMISGGPEGIHGLPGMILGVGIPRLHTTWFATKVQVNDVPVKQIEPEKKGKKVNRQEMIQSLNKAMKDWDVHGQKIILAAQI